MFNNKVLTTAAILIALLGFATVQMRAEIPIVQADTIFQGFGGGSVSGIVFGPTGETVILMHGAQPVEIDIKTKQVIREFEKVPNASGEGPHLFFYKQKNYVGGTFYSSEYFDGKAFSGEIIWDYLTGKIIKAIPKILLLTDANMERFYTYFNHNFCSYDFETFKFKDSFNLNSIKSSYAEWRGYGIIPNSNKVLLGLNNYTENEQGKRTYLLSELYLLDFDTKKYTKIPIPYEAGQKSSAMGDITVTETGKYNIVRISQIYYFFDKDFKFLYKLSLSDFELMTNIANLSNYSIITTMSDEYIIYFVYNQSATQMKMIFYNIQERNITKYLGFLGSGVYDKTTKLIALYGDLGKTGIYPLSALPVKENIISTEMQNTVLYKDNNLIVNSLIAEKVDLNINDYQGNLLQSQKNVFLHNGSNRIKLNSPLGNGAYFCVIKTQNTTDYYKFMVNN